VSDEIRFPFEVKFLNSGNITLQIPIYSRELIERVMMFANDRWREIIRANMKDIFEILNLNVSAEIVVGQQNWAWLWSEYPSLSTKRHEQDTTFATLVKSKAIDQFVLKTD
jgi:hypothetical protein